MDNLEQLIKDAVEELERAHKGYHEAVLEIAAVLTENEQLSDYIKASPVREHKASTLMDDLVKAATGTCDVTHKIKSYLEDLLDGGYSDSPAGLAQLFGFDFEVSTNLPPGIFEGLFSDLDQAIAKEQSNSEVHLTEEDTSAGGEFSSAFEGLVIPDPEEE